MNKLLLIIVIFALSTFSQLFAVINSFPHTESFEGAEFPPNGWILEPIVGQTINLERQTKDPENPTIYDTPNGENWVKLENVPGSTNHAILWSPRLDFPAGNTFYQITISIYVTNNTNSNIQINRGSTQDAVGPCLGQFSNTPIAASVGWHDFSIGLGYLGGTSQYIALTVNDFYEDVNFDNIRIEEGNPWNIIYPYDNSTDVSYIWSGWSQYTVLDGNYSLYFSKDNTNFTLEYQGVNNSTILAYQLLPNTTYHWYVVAQEYGNTRLSPTWSFTTGNRTFPFIESFESAAFPPDGWIFMPTGGEPILTLETNAPLNPTIYDTPYGDHWVSLPYNTTTANAAVMWTPKIEFPPGDTFYKLTMSHYVTNNSTSNIQVNMGPTLYNYGPAIVQIANTVDNSPVGWQDGSANLGFVGGTSQYIALRVTDFGEAINFDNIRIAEASPWSDISPADGTAISDAHPMFNWGDFWSASNQYTFYMSTNNIDFIPDYTGYNNDTYLDYPLASGTTYYWYVVANGDGYSVSSPVWSFTMGDAVTPPDVIVDFPYLADFQVEDPLWTLMPMGKNASLGKLNLANLTKQPLLQKRNIMSKDEEYPWGRVLDGEANYARKLQAGYVFGLISPYFLLNVGETYELKYNYREGALSTSTEMEGMVVYSDPDLSVDGYLDFNVNITNTDYALRKITFTPGNTNYFRFIIIGISSVDLYIDNFRITKVGDDVLTAADFTVDGISTPNPAPIFNTETQQPLDTDLHITNIAGTPEITATVSWTPPVVGSQDTGLTLNLHSSAGGLAGAVVTFIHNLGYTPEAISYRIVPNSFAPLINPNDGSWNATQCRFTLPAVKADGDFEVILHGGNQALPVELSSFTSTITSENYVNLQWVTQSETNHLGFNVLRATTDDFQTAIKVNSTLISQGTSSGTQTTYSFVDDEVVMDNTYYFWLESIALNGYTEEYGPLMAVLGQPVDPNDPPVIPLATSLQNAYPNPFSSNTTLCYSLKDMQNVRLDIYNVKGQLIRSFSTENKAAGNHSLAWDGKEANGREVTSGVYFYRMTAGKYTATRKLMFVK